MYSLNVTAKGGYTPEKGYTHLFLDKDNKVETIKLKEIIMYKGVCQESCVTSNL